MKHYRPRITPEQKEWVKQNSTLPASELYKQFHIRFEGSYVSKSSLTSLRTRMGCRTSQGESGSPKKSIKPPLKKEDGVKGTVEYYQTLGAMEWEGGLYKIGRFGFLFVKDPVSKVFVKSNRSRAAFMKALDSREARSNKISPS